MNTDTGQIYRGGIEITAAMLRGEPVVEVSEHVAETMELGNRAQRRRAEQAKRRAAKRG
jgi:hypothetical protein